MDRCIPSNKPILTEVVTRLKKLYAYKTPTPSYVLALHCI